MPRALSNLTLLYLNKLLLELSRNRTGIKPGFITTQRLDEICELDFSKKTDTRNKARARYINKLRELYNADLVYDRANKRYVLRNSPSFVINLNLSLKLSPETFAAFSAGNIFVSKFLPHLAESSTSFQNELEKIFDSTVFSEGRALASSVTISLPITRVNAADFSLVQQALREGRTISFSYNSPYSKKMKTLKRHEKYSPWGVYFTDRSWYVWGILDGREEGMPCKLCRMKDIELGDKETYSSPSEGQKPQKILRSLWFARPGTPRYEVTLSFAPPLATSIEEIEWPEDVTITKNESSGEVTLCTRVPDLHGVAFFVLSGAPYAVAVEPAELRQLVIDISEKQHEAQQSVDENELAMMKLEDNLSDESATERFEEMLSWLVDVVYELDEPSFDLERS